MNTSSIVLGEISEYFELDNRILVIQNLDEPEPYGCEYWATLQQADSFDIIYDGNEPFLFNLFAICLLYTSPSPRDRQKSRMPSSA